MKLLFTIPFTVFTFWLAAQAPVNDDCAGIITLGTLPYCSDPAQFTNVDATASNIDPVFNIPACFNNNAERDVWFQFTLPSDGSITDVTISIFGDVGGNGTMHMPEVALYRGDCAFGGLSELDCAAAPLNVDELHLTVLNLNPGDTYFLRINDYSATGTPNAGTFKLCVEKYVPDFNMGEETGSQSCSGTLWDSGGPGGEYSSDENLTFTICPLDFHQCIQINILDYFTEEGYDYLRIYEGGSTSGTLLAEFDDIGSNKQVNVSGGGCATIEFLSDPSNEYDGFHLTWQCTADECPAPPPMPPSASLCDAALQINGCSQEMSNLITLAPGDGDPNFIVNGVNSGCILIPSQDYNFAFFYFKAQADGEFGFLVRNGNLNTPSDIDFSVWGPIADAADICDFVTNNQPIRSSWTFGPDSDNPDGWTGLTNTNPYTNAPITDEFDCGDPSDPGTGNLPTDDSFVQTIQVHQGEIYIVMLDDYDGAVEGDGISMDFSGTSTGILGPNANESITLTDDLTICAGGTPVPLEVAGGLDYAWEQNNTLSCDECPNPIALPFETTTYIVQVATACALYNDSVTITIPVLELGPQANVCIGAEFTLNQHALPGQYTWSGSGLPFLNCNNCASPLFSAMTAGTYTLTADLITPPSCTLSATLVINVSAGTQPDISILPDTSICLGEIITLEAAPNLSYQYEWTSNPPNLVPGSVSTPFAPGSSVTYYVKVTSAGCNIPLQDSVIIGVFARPQYDFPAIEKKCAGYPLVLNLLNDPSVNVWNWSSNPPLTIDQTAQPEVILQSSGIDKPVSFYLEASNGCTIRDTFTIPVTGVGLEVSDPATICDGDRKVLNATVLFGGGIYTWSNGANTQTIEVKPTVTTTYSVSYDFQGCTFQDSVVITVSGQVPEVQFPTVAAVCAGDSILLNSVETMGADYSWVSSDGLFMSDKAIIYSPPLDTTTTFILTATSLDGCKRVDNLKITVFKASVAVPEDFTVCPDIEFDINATPSVTGIFEWSPITNPPSLPFTGAFFSDTLSIAQNATYNLHFIYGTVGGNECFIDTSVVVTVLPNFNIKIIPEPKDSTVNAGEDVTLLAIIQPSQNLNGFSFEWFESQTNPVGENEEEITVTPSSGLEFVTYTVIITPPSGCSQIQSITIRVYQPLVEIPNAFTPNGDGSNDVFRLAVLEGKVIVEHFEIYNRWGQKVFESTEPEAEWDGKTQGEDAPSDVYIYKIRYRRSDGSLAPPEKGELTLIR